MRVTIEHTYSHCLPSSLTVGGSKRKIIERRLSPDLFVPFSAGATLLSVVVLVLTTFKNRPIRFVDSTVLTIL